MEEVSGGIGKDSGAFLIALVNDGMDQNLGVSRVVLFFWGCA